jgi:hypothetical protein
MKEIESNVGVPFMNKFVVKILKITGVFFSAIIVFGLLYYIVRNELTPKYQMFIVEPSKIEFSRNLNGEITILETGKIVANEPLKVQNVRVQNGEFVKSGTELMEIALKGGIENQSNDEQKQMELLRINNQMEDNAFQIDQSKRQLAELESQLKTQKTLYEEGTVTGSDYQALKTQIETLKQEIGFKVEQKRYYEKQIQVVKSSSLNVKQALFFANTQGLVAQEGNRLIATQDLYIINISDLGTDVYSGSELISFAAINGENIAVKCSVADELRDKFEHADTIQMLSDGKSFDMNVIKKVNQKPMQVYLKPEMELKGSMIGQMTVVKFKCTVDADLAVPLSAVIPEKMLKEGESGTVYRLEKNTDIETLYSVQPQSVTIEFVGDNFVAIKTVGSGRGMTIVKAPESSEIADMKVRIYD